MNTKVGVKRPDLKAEADKANRARADDAYIGRAWLTRTTEREDGSLIITVSGMPNSHAYGRILVAEVDDGVVVFRSVETKPSLSVAA